MKLPFKTLFFIDILFLIAIFIALPRDFSINLPAPLNINKEVHLRSLDIPLGAGRLYRDLNTKLGLDLQGGTQLVLESDMSKIPSGDRDDALESVKEVIDRRVNFFGVSEPVIQTSKVGDSHRVLVELPGVNNTEEAINLVGTTAQLSFGEIDESSPSAEAATESASLFGFTKKAGLSGKHLKRSQVVFDPETGNPVVQLEFTSEGSKLFADITSRNIGKPLAIFLDDQLITAPNVDEAITSGPAIIRGQFTTEEAKSLAISLNAGALPVPVKIIEQRSIGATLGEQVIHNSIIAGIMGLSIVAIFMIALYGWKGVIADVALVMYAIFTLALFKLVPITLTLAGIAGFILSIGMAVDANILIFERIKEEIRMGRSKKLAIELGFSRAFPSIRDSNFSSLITCFILYWFGTGAVRGFAVTLALGIVVSLFSSITVTKTLLQIFQRGEVKPKA